MDQDNIIKPFNFEIHKVVTREDIEKLQVTEEDEQNGYKRIQCFIEAFKAAKDMSKNKKKKGYK